MRELPLDEKLELVMPYLVAAGLVEEPADEATRRRVELILRAAGDRIVVAGDILAYREFFVPTAELTYDEAAFEKRVRVPQEAKPLLAGFRAELAGLTAFDAETLEASLRSYVERRGVKLGQVIHALRVAATGKAVGFGMFEAHEILGRSSTLARIDRAVGRQ